MKIVVIDGQGGKLGRLIIEQIASITQEHEIFAIGTNSIATAAMLRAGANFGATGENPVSVNSKDADIIIGPIGIIIADSLIGEVTAKMAIDVGRSKAKKILIPVNKCNNYVAGIKEIAMSELIRLAVREALE